MGKFQQFKNSNNWTAKAKQKTTKKKKTIGPSGLSFHFDFLFVRISRFRDMFGCVVISQELLLKLIYAHHQIKLNEGLKWPNLFLNSIYTSRVLGGNVRKMAKNESIKLQVYTANDTSSCRA